MESSAEVKWFELPGPGFMAFHVANAFEDVNGDVKVGHWVCVHGWVGGWVCGYSELVEGVQSWLRVPRSDLSWL